MTETMKKTKTYLLGVKGYQNRSFIVTLITGPAEPDLDSLKQQFFAEYRIPVGDLQTSNPLQVEANFLALSRARDRLDADNFDGFGGHGLASQFVQWLEARHGFTQVPFEEYRF